MYLSLENIKKNNIQECTKSVPSISDVENWNHKTGILTKEVQNVSLIVGLG